MNNLFICTFYLDEKKELENYFKFVQQVKMNDKILYIFLFDNKMYSKFNKKDKVFIMNRLFF